MDPADVEHIRRLCERYGPLELADAVAQVATDVADQQSGADHLTDPHCSFCATRRSECGDQMVAGARVFICSRCIDICYRIRCEKWSEPAGEIRSALYELQAWLRAGGPEFWPKEEAVQAWFCAALQAKGFARHAMEIVQEVHLGDKYPSDPHSRAALARHVPGKEADGHVRFDVVVLEEKAGGDVRNLESCSTAPRLVSELKSLNSAGTLKTRSIRDDVRKLQAAREYIDGRFAQNHCTFLLVLVATAWKDRAQGDAETRIDEIMEWLVGEADREPTVSIALVGADRIEPRVRWEAKL